MYKTVKSPKNLPVKICHLKRYAKMRRNDQRLREVEHSTFTLLLRASNNVLQAISNPSFPETRPPRP